MEGQYTPNPSLEPCYSMLLLRPFLEVLSRPGLNDAALFRSLLQLPDDARIPVRKVLHWLTNQVQVTSDADLGLRAVSRLSRGAGDVVELAASTAATCGEAMQLFLRYIAILNEAADFSMKVQAGRAHVALRSHVPLPRVAADFQVGAMLAALRAWLGTLAGIEVELAHDRPRDDRLYRELFAECTFHFGAACDGLRFDAALLATPLESADVEVHRVLVCHAEQTASSLAVGDQLTPRVRKLLLTLLPVGDSRASRVAGELGLSRRTLTRKLRSEGVSFKEVLEGCRHVLALQYLKQTSHESQEIAALLGYSMTAAFSRAFVRWEGMTPTEYRRCYREQRARKPTARLRSAS